MDTEVGNEVQINMETEVDTEVASTVVQANALDRTGILKRD